MCSFPSALKIAKVVHVHKKDSKLSTNLISLLSNFDKILEKLMYTRIFKFFNNNNLFYHLEFGVRQNYYVTHALISLTKTGNI